MKTSETLTELYKALLLFQKKIGKIEKKSDNPFFKSKYAALDTIIDMCRPVLCDCGLIITQTVSGNNSLTTRLAHISGEYIEDTMISEPVPSREKDKDTQEVRFITTPQGVGSNITYMRRYAYQSILSLSIGVNDDDGNKASGNIQQKKTHKKNILNVDSFTGDQWDNLMYWIKSNDTGEKTFKASDLVSRHYICEEIQLRLIDENYDVYK